jgi:hypothetical protein
MSGNMTIEDVRLTANVTYLPGPEPEAGSGVLLAKGPFSSRVELTLTDGGKRTEIRNRVPGPNGKWIDPDGKSGRYALHNCWTDAAWFFPLLSSLASTPDSKVVFSYLGQGTWNGLSVTHLRVYQAQDGIEDAQRLSSEDIYIDPSSMFVLGMSYKTHPDKNMNVDIPSEVRFADYRRVNGVAIPFRIQRLEGGVLTDIVVTDTSFNVGVSEATFDTH